MHYYALYNMCLNNEYIEIQVHGMQQVQVTKMTRNQKSQILSKQKGL